jgi:protein TonB
MFEEAAGTRPLAQGGNPMAGPTLTFSSYALTDVDPLTRRRRGLTLPLSVVLHGLAALAVVVLPLLFADSLPEPSGTRAFFVEPLAIAPPAPPPPPPPAGRVATTRVTPPAVAAPAGFVAPIEVPTEIKPEEGLDLGVEGGVLGGVEGGIPGGVVGGVVGGLPDAPPPPRAAAVRVGGQIREPRKLVHVVPVYPELARQARVQGFVIVEATIDARGRVEGATVLRSIPLLDDAALEAVRKWVYAPTLLNGVPTPIIMTVTLVFQLKTAD